jgi:hypothetical protein
MITIAGKNCKEVLGPIYDRLEDESSLLRRAGDVSMLAQALLDVCKWNVWVDANLVLIF